MTFWIYIHLFKRLNVFIYYTPLKDSNYFPSLADIVLHCTSEVGLASVVGLDMPELGSLLDVLQDVLVLCLGLALVHKLH